MSASAPATIDVEQAYRDYGNTLLAMRAQRDRRKIDGYYLATGPLRRELYKPHLAFFAAGATQRERLFLAANRVGKTEGVGCYELACHLTGEYPDWWTGRRFKKRIKAWAAGDTAKTVREIIQDKLLGPPGHLGTGMLPAASIRDTSAKSGVPDAIDTVRVQHKSGGISTLVLKSYDQRRESFQGADMDVVWLDEEPPEDIYTECLMRTMTTGGLLLLTFTPLQGLTEVVLKYLPDGNTERTAKFVVFATWDDVPHLSADVKQELWNSIPPYQRDARSKGLPSLGSGAIYPVPESDIIVPDFLVPQHWPRAYGMDVGWNCTAAVWSAHNRETDVMYLYSEYYRGEAEPSIHVQAIQARGAWIQGAIDPASRGRSQVDGRQLLQMYTDLGLRLSKADNSVEAGIYKLWQRFSSGRLKVFASCTQFMNEFRLYRRDEKGKVVKERDHLMDACFAGDTRVITAEGAVPIADLVGKDGMALSRCGSWARFCGARKTIEDAPVVRLSFDDGSEVVCTPDHPFLTPSGWAQAIDMPGRKVYNGVSQSIQVSQCKYTSLRQLLKSLTDVATICAGSISNATGFGSIASFGKLCMDSPYLTGSPSTTSTEADPTTNQKTLRYCHSQATPDCTKRGMAGASLRLPWMPLGSGTDLQMGSSGTGSTTKTPRTDCTLRGPSSAYAAERNSPHKLQGLIGSVLTTARLSTVRRLAWTMRNALAWFVAAGLWRIATSKKERAQSSVVSCLACETAGRRDVYCLTVPGTSSFCLANGAVVHNTRYLHAEMVNIEKVEPVKPGFEARPYVLGSRSSGSWMA